MKKGVFVGALWCVLDDQLLNGHGYVTPGSR